MDNYGGADEGILLQNEVIKTTTGQIRLLQFRAKMCLTKSFTYKGAGFLNV